MGVRRWGVGSINEDGVNGDDIYASVGGGGDGRRFTADGGDGVKSTFAVAAKDDVDNAADIVAVGIDGYNSTGARLRTTSERKLTRTQRAVRAAAAAAAKRELNFIEGKQVRLLAHLHMHAHANTRMHTLIHACAHVLTRTRAQSQSQSGLGLGLEYTHAHTYSHACTHVLTRTRVQSES
jgi:hypothetical protein